jgi:lysophospholipase L1-like esterase
MGHFGRDFSTNKPPDTIRIACLGASTTANNIADEKKDYSYPELLEQYLIKKFKDYHLSQKIEVYNCGIGGWVSTDILINFQLNILHTNPDYVILYHGCNDLHLYLTEDFSTDYYHGRKNLGEVLPIIKRAYYLPKIKFWHLYEFLKDKTLGTGNIRNDLLRLITKQNPDISRDFKNLEIENQILKNILIICKYYKIECVLSSFCYYCYRNDPVTVKYAEGVRIENELKQKLAEEFNATFIDMAAIMPYDDKNFVDAVHFTPKGMGILAKCFGDAIIKDLAKKVFFKKAIPILSDNNESINV